ncbi:unnamed protein product [Staurois parvus]|uniref:Pectate lyase n=1 Tax=Staurois parvus TaxID=386267 RepID=A0ABN9DI86_9NEOB|nr:unnamed protein product [Staurois parvus]
MQGPGRADIVNAGSRESDIVNAGSGRADIVNVRISHNIVTFGYKDINVCGARK